MVVFDGQEWIGRGKGWKALGDDRWAKRIESKCLMCLGLGYGSPFNITLGMWMSR